MTDVSLIVQRLGLRKRGDEESGGVTVSCKLIPASQIAIYVVILVVLSTLSWLGFGAGGTFAVLSAIAQFFIILCVIAGAVRLKVRLSDKGIEATSTLHKQSLYDRSLRHWNDLHSVRLRKLKSPLALLERLRGTRQRLRRVSPAEAVLDFLGRSWQSQGFLVLDFRSGGLIAFPLAGFSAKALEDFFVSLCRWADPMTLNPDVISLQRDVLAGQPLQLCDSYTRMWEENLRQAFEVTNFVPLPGGHELRGGEITILMQLACGGLSSVYLARLSDGTKVVIKEMSLPLDGSDPAAAKVHEMFSREAEILARLDHPRIVRILDHFVENGRDYLCLEFVPGLTLRQHVQLHGPFSEVDAITIGKQIADMLCYLHGFEPPIVHRDITPDNLVIKEPERSLILIDFGAANEFVGKVTGTLIGKQCYIPPEQFRGQAIPQSDIYAAGATLHFVLTGNDPEPISSSHPRSIVATVSHQLDELVALATAPETNDRLACSLEFKHALTDLRRRIRPETE